MKMDKKKLLDDLDIGLTSEQKDKLKLFLEEIENNEIINDDDEFSQIQLEETPVFSFDGKYKECYIRLSSNDVKDLKDSLNEIYKD